MREIDIKLVCVGAANTGKTTFLRCWETGDAPVHLSTTIQMEFHRREMSIAVPSPVYFEQKNRSAEEFKMTASTHSENNNAPGGNNQSLHREVVLGCSGGNSNKKDSTHNSALPSSWRFSRNLNEERLFSSSVSKEYSNNGSRNSMHGIPHNPFGSDYAILPPQIPPPHLNVFPSGGSTGKRICSLFYDKDMKNENEGKWPLVHVPAIVKVWDIQGQESTKKMTRIFYTGAIAVLIFCEMSDNMDSLISALSWKSDVAQKIHIPKEKSLLASSTSPSFEGKSDARDENLPRGQIEEIESENPPCWLVVNKYDLLSSLASPPEWASHAALDELCARHGFAGWSYAIGRRGVNVEAVVQAVIFAAMKRFPHKFTWVWRKETIHVTPSGKGNGVDPVVLRTARQLKKHQRRGCCSK
ncbi:ras-related protein rab, putative [Trypanosoma cruzi marinkellei]|uniref:Ras-related protein rab, putative n=1 Tax=Trypanosoma cruzi marinkellei TaxID=85056 RepID=K2PCI5_TRYCR|nr:ras-related protein rab, putative [Trypanosoma cruzi marinkellei]